MQESSACHATPGLLRGCGTAAAADITCIPSPSALISHQFLNSGTDTCFWHFNSEQPLTRREGNPSICRHAPHLLCSGSRSASCSHCSRLQQQAEDCRHSCMQASRHSRALYHSTQLT